MLRWILRIVLIIIAVVSVRSLYVRYILYEPLGEFYAEQIRADKTEKYTLAIKAAYDKQIVASRSEEQARAIVRIFEDAYVEQIDAGKWQGYAVDYASQRAAGKSEEYAHAYAE